jgi:hypothetical protein
MEHKIQGRRKYMEQPYQEPPYQEEDYYVEAEPKKGMSGWLIALIVVLVLIVLCCICVCLGTLVVGPAFGTTFSTIIEEMVTPFP